MILEHVPHHPSLLVVTRPVLYTECLCAGNLYVVDILTVPDGVKDGVRETEHEDILNRLLTKVVIDSEYLPFLKVEVYLFIELPRRGQAAAKGLLDNDAGPPLPLL